jgi:phosphatidylethanolamine-binding protein (PEBP) family uncharacterized protein
MGRLANLTVSGVLVLGLAVTGCGSSSSTSSSTQSASASQTSSSQKTSAGTGTQPSGSTPSGQTQTLTAPKEHLATVDITLSIPAFENGRPITTRYTCDGADVSPAVHWSAIPHGTAELVLYLTTFKVAADGDPSILWAVAGLRPTLKGIAAGALPAGAVLGRNSNGQSRYSLCPPKGSGTEHYIASLFALRHPVSVKTGFDASALQKTVANAAEFKGLAGFSYERQ